MGVISVISNIIPQETHDICAKFFEGDIEGSRKMFLQYMSLIKTLFIEVNPIPVKTAMNLMGFNVGKFRMPLCDMVPENLEKLKIVLKNCNLL